jgi:NAD(P)-dependent dehydrogenase (short-subunit alcohol dehydrogenase family)
MDTKRPRAGARDARGGAVGLTQTAHLEFAPHGVSASGVLPSAVRTGRSSGNQQGHGKPTGDPQDIAAAILRTCETRKAEVPVPGYLSALDLSLAMAPERLLNLVRRAVGDRRVQSVSTEKTAT